MKKLNITFVIVVLFGLLYSNESNAQFLKQTMNSVKQTAQNRANSKIILTFYEHSSLVL